jgi:hypothetical protein
MTFALSRMCHGEPQPPLEQLLPIIYFGVSLALDKTCSYDATRYALHCLADIAGGGIEGAQAVSEIGAYALTQRLVHILSQLNCNQLLYPALRTLRTICDHGHAFDHVQAVVKAGILDFAQNFLEPGASKASKLEMCKLLSKIAAGRKTVSQLVDNSPVLSTLVYMAMEGTCEWLVRKEAIQVVCNIAHAPEDEVVEILVSHDGIEALVEALRVRIDDSVLLEALNAVEQLFKVGERAGAPYGLMIDQWGGIDKLEALQNHGNDDIAGKAEDIVEQYLCEDEEEEDNKTCCVYSPECYKYDQLYFAEDCQEMK